MDRIRAKAAAAFIAVIVLVGVAAACGSSGGSERPATAPPADGVSQDRRVSFLAPSEFDTSAYLGGPLVVNFFGSWCGPCNQEAPELAEFVAANPDVAVVGIAVSDREDAVRSFMQQYGLAFPVVMDDNSLSASWAIRGVPTTIFVNGAGQEVDRLVGAAGLDRFEQSLQKAR